MSTEMSKTDRKRIAQGVFACWLEDCDQAPTLNKEQVLILLHHIEIGVMLGGDNIK